MEFSKVQEVDTQKMLQKHILGKDDNIFQVEHGQPVPFSATKNHYQKIDHGDPPIKRQRNFRRGSEERFLSIR